MKTVYIYTTEYVVNVAWGMKSTHVLGPGQLFMKLIGCIGRENPPTPTGPENLI